MKTLIVLILIASVFAVVGWHWRKSQLEADVARRKSLDRKRKEKKESITPAEDMIWPTVGPSEDGEVAEDSDLEEPSMATIEYVPPD